MTNAVKKLQIMIEKDLDAALDRMALQEGTSKAALIRRFVRQNIEPLPSLHEDPLWRMVGAIDADPGGIDEVVYGLSPESER